MRACLTAKPDSPFRLRRAYQCLVSGCVWLALATSVFAQQVTTSKTGNRINATVSASLTGTQCCVCLGLDSPGAPGNCFCTQPCPSATLPYSWTCNSVGTHTVTGCMLGSETNYKYVRSEE